MAFSIFNVQSRWGQSSLCIQSLKQDLLSEPGTVLVLGIEQGTNLKNLTMIAFINSVEKNLGI